MCYTNRLKQLKVIKSEANLSTLAGDFSEWKSQKLNWKNVEQLVNGNNRVVLDVNTLDKINYIIYAKLIDINQFDRCSTFLICIYINCYLIGYMSLYFIAQ